MSSAVLKFQEASPEPLDSAVLAAAVEASPQPLAITESGKLIYKNHSFAQLMSCHSPKGLTVALNDASWQTSEFDIGGQTFSLTTQPQKWIGSIESLLRPPTVFILC